MFDSQGKESGMLPSNLIPHREKYLLGLSTPVDTEFSHRMLTYVNSFLYLLITFPLT